MSSQATYQRYLKSMVLAKKFRQEKDEYKKIILVLKILQLEIEPYSLNSRLGYKKYLDRAIKILEERNE